MGQKSYFIDAVMLAMQAHSGQFRKNSRKQFIIHPLRVSESILKRCKENPLIDKLRAAAVLHDTIEDTWINKDYLENHFDSSIAKWVWEVTEDQSLPPKERTIKYVKKLSGASDYGKFIKLADIMDNLKDPLPEKSLKGYLHKSLIIIKALEVDCKSDIFREFNHLKKDIIKEILKMQNSNH